MAVTTEGRIKQVCNKHGWSFSFYQSQINKGLKWCYSCKSWQPRSNFNIDKCRYDGLNAKCKNRGCSRVLNPRTTKGMVSSFKNKKHKPETIERIRELAKKRPPPMLNRKHTEESRRKMSITKRLTTKRGKEHHNYIHGNAERNRNDRRNPKYKDWRDSVFNLDKYRCQKCGDKKGGNLIAHHLNSFHAFPDERFDISNGGTLCEKCHTDFHNMNGYTNNNKEQFIEFITNGTYVPNLHF